MFVSFKAHRDHTTLAQISISKEALIHEPGDNAIGVAVVIEVLLRVLHPRGDRRNNNCSKRGQGMIRK
jgi:hypothetical protein